MFVGDQHTGTALAPAALVVPQVGMAVQRAGMLLTVQLPDRSLNVQGAYKTPSGWHEPLNDLTVGLGAC